MSDAPATPPGPPSGEGHEQLERLIGRLEEAAARLRDEELEPDQAASVVEQCATFASQASAELERLARVAASEPLPGQDQLL